MPPQATPLASYEAAAPWTSVPDPGKPGVNIPFLHATCVPGGSVKKNTSAATITKPVRYLLVTTSDGGRLIHDHTGYAKSEICDTSSPLYLSLMCQLGAELAKIFGLGPSSPSSGSSRKAADNKTWNVLAQLPLKYNAYYRGRSNSNHLDLYIVGHDATRFDSVAQFAKHLAWLARSTKETCSCRVCRNERRQVPAAAQRARKKIWAGCQRPVLSGVPSWIGDEEWEEEEEGEEEEEEEREEVEREDAEDEKVEVEREDAEDEKVEVEVEREDAEDEW